METYVPTRTTIEYDVPDAFEMETSVPTALCDLLLRYHPMDFGDAKVYQTPKSHKSNYVMTHFQSEENLKT